MYFYIDKDKNVHRMGKEEPIVTNVIPTGIYALRNSNNGMYLEHQDSFKPSGKIYGDMQTRADRILSTFKHRETSTGVMLSGRKGSGKTMTAREVSIKGLNDDIITILVNEGFDSAELSEFIDSIEQDAIVIFDEFEKNYKNRSKDNDRASAQEGLLALFDGVSQKKKLYILTTNAVKYEINSFFLDRPGRIFYHFEHDHISPDVITEFCNEHMKNPTHKDQMLILSKIIYDFNFDILKAIIEECNRYNESPMIAIKYMNVSKSMYISRNFHVTVKKGDKIIVEENEDVSISPDMSYEFLYDENDNSYEKTVTMQHLVDISSKKIVFKIEDFVVTMNENISMMKDLKDEDKIESMMSMMKKLM